MLYFLGFLFILGAIIIAHAVPVTFAVFLSAAILGITVGIIGDVRSVNPATLAPIRLGEALDWFAGRGPLSLPLGLRLEKA